MQEGGLVIAENIIHDLSNRVKRLPSGPGEGIECNFSFPVEFDFGTGNILVDKLTKRAMGVIDFGSVSIGDPAVDYAAVSTMHPKYSTLSQSRIRL